MLFCAAFLLFLAVKTNQIRGEKIITSKKLILNHLSNLIKKYFGLYKNIKTFYLKPLFLN